MDAKPSLWFLPSFLSRFALVATAALLSPLIILVFYGFSPPGWQALLGLFASGRGLKMIVNTVVLAAIVGVFGTIVGALAAWVQVLVRPWGRRWLHAMLLVPLVLPPFIIPAVLTMMLGRNGLLTRTLFGSGLDFYGLGALALTQVISFSPLSYVFCLRVLQGLNPRFISIALTLGSRASLISWRLVFPVLRKAARSSFALVAVASMADLATPLVLAGDYTVLSRGAYTAAIADYDYALAAVIAIILLVIASALNLVAGRQNAGGGLSGLAIMFSHRQGPGRINNSPRATYLLSLPIYLVALGNFALIAAVVFSVFSPIPGLVGGFSFINFAAVTSSISVVGSTVMLSAAALPLVLLLALGLVQWYPVSYLGRGFQSLLRLGFNVPGTVVGVAFLLCFVSPWQVGGWSILPGLVGGAGLGQGAVIIVASYILRSLSVSVSLLRLAYSRLEVSRVQTALSLGASTAQVRRVILAPALAPALIMSASLSFLTSMSSLSAVAFISSSQWNLLTLQMFSQVDEANYGPLFASALVALIIMVAVQGVFGKWSLHAERLWAGHVSVGAREFLPRRFRS